jgi:putative ABC transport system permease protein
MNKTDLNYLTRSLLKDKSSSITGILGYAVALSCSILIMVYIKFEISYDRFHQSPESLYRIAVRLCPENAYMGNDLFIPTPGALCGLLKNEVPGVESAARYYHSSHTVENEGNVFRENGFLYADESFLDLFSFPVLTGSPGKAFQDPYAMLITDSMAEKYFGDDDPVGKTLRVDNSYTYSIVGIISDPPLNSHIAFSFISGMPTYLRVRRSAEQKINSWTDNDFFTYVRLDDRTTPDQVAKQLDRLDDAHLEGKGEFFSGMKWELQPVTKIHLGGNANFEPGKNSSSGILWILATTGLLIILLATLNYLNLSMAQVLQRGKEIGVLKMAGITNKRLVFQLVGETLLLSIMGALLALVIVWMALPPFSALVGRELNFGMVLNPVFPGLVMILTLVVGLIPGFVSTLTMSSANPVSLLNGSPVIKMGKTKPGRVRRLIVTLQYSVSVVGLVIALTILLQINHIRKKDVGYAADNIINIYLTDPRLKENADILISELQGIPEVEKVALSSHLPGAVNASSFGYWEGKPEDKKQIVYNMGIDERFVSLYNMEIVTGRDFSSLHGSDIFEACLINETAAAVAGWTDPVGKRFGFNDHYKGSVVGVVRDFNFQSASYPVEPLIIFPLGSAEYKTPLYVSVAVRIGSMERALRSVTEVVNRLSPGYLNQITILRDRIERQYSDEKRHLRIAVALSFLAVILTCMGQYALSRYEIRRRTGEVVIRKINGATRHAIVKLFIGEEARQIAIASLVALPVAWFFNSGWLENYAYRINQGPLLFLIPIIVVFLLSVMVTISQIVRISAIKPGHDASIAYFFRC